MVRQAEAIDVDGHLEEQTKCPCDLMMGCASAVIPDGNREDIIRHSLMPMIPPESSMCHTKLGSCIPWSGY